MNEYLVHRIRVTIQWKK